MTFVRTVSVALIAAILVSVMPSLAWAGEDVAPAASVDLRAAIDRAAAQAVTARDVAGSPNETRAAARARQGMGGGGGSMMMVWTVVGTVTGLATTYFVVKEMRKQTDKANAPQ
jgi:hypothetical protein